MLNNWKWKNYFLVLLKISVFANIILKPSVCSLEITEAKAKIGDHKIIERLDLFLVDHNERKKLNVSIGFAKELKSLEANLSLKLEREPNKWRTLLHKKLDGCKFLKGDYQNNIALRAVYEAISRFPTFSQKCPIPAHYVYKAELMDIYLIYPSYLPNISFIGSLAVSLKGHLLYQIDVMGFTQSKDK